MADKLGFIQEKDMADFARLMRDYRAGRLYADPNRPTPVNGPNQRWIRARNDCSDTIPGYGVVAVIDAKLFDQTQTLLSVGYQSITTDNNAGTLAVNSASPILPGEIGLVTLDFPAWARLYSGHVENMAAGAVCYVGSGGFELYFTTATTTNTSQTTLMQLVSEPVPISGGYLGLVKFVSDNAYAFCQVDHAAYASSAEGWLGLSASSVASSGVQIDTSNDKIIFRKAGHYIVRCSLNLLLGYDSRIDYSLHVFDPTDTTDAFYSPIRVDNNLTADNISGYTWTHADLSAAVYANENYYLKIVYECETSGTFFAAGGYDESSIEVRRCG